MSKTTLFDAVGGLPVLRQVHHELYNRLYAHAWLGQYFAGTKQHLIEEKQTMFMAEKMGDSHRFVGHEPELAHRRMYIPDALFDLRQRILLSTLCDGGVAEPLRTRWLKIDNAFRRHIVSPSAEAFAQRDLGCEQPLNFPAPVGHDEKK
ncbi:MAG: group 1 truncated hemoglobin [Mariprofundaceae bacterium]|nr:group 1 truncated hemoglobin [Mariprofundaceae bacterium]